MTQIILPTLIFNETFSNEQQVKLIEQYGADGIEIRRERLQDIAVELAVLKNSINASGLNTVIYSAPIELWQDGYSLNPLVITAINEAKQLNADYIKLSLGRFDANLANTDDFQKWLDHNSPANIKVLIENDQTIYGGTLIPILSFFQWKQDKSIGMTFDVGNWTVNKEDWLTAYNSLHQWIEYFHLKSVTRSMTGWESKAISTEHLNLTFPVYTAIEFPLDNPNVEGPQWVTKLRKEVTA
ncbi:sugar phosphate isomerase/epimerase family protein [Virgibacillus phasianinus]|uniref:sugar phosphate isomerase/epimerase family protein n=1 Tax=Virgibacillus phasianinus TaxID=2017483 RepID=UPI0012FD8199|nr:TIM barrel protein [Virgibacillus phasianinus]